MGISLTTGRTRQCKSESGLRKIYLFPFVKYSRSQIVRTDLVLTTFPVSTIYEFVSVGNPSFNNPMSENEGGKFYNETITLTFPKIDTTNEFQKLLNKDYRMIVQQADGVFRLLGAYNGGIFSNLAETTGGGKSDFSGYTIDFSGQEEQPALFINDLGLAGFTIFTGTTDNFIFQDGNNFIFQDSNNYILQ